MKVGEDLDLFREGLGIGSGELDKMAERGGFT